MKILLGNLIFGLILLSWYFYVGDSMQWMLPGVLLAFAAFMLGVFMGYLLRGPGKRRRTAAENAALATAAAGFDVIPMATHYAVPPPFVPIAPEVPGHDDLDLGSGEPVALPPPLPQSGETIDTQYATLPEIVAPAPPVVVLLPNHPAEAAMDVGGFVASVD